MRDSLVDPGRQQAEKLHGDVKCPTLHGRVVPRKNSVPDTIKIHQD